MKFVIGGESQGKLEYVIKKYDISEENIADEKNTDPEKNIRCINNYHLIIKSIIENGRDPYEETLKILERYPDVIVIMNEIGNGIVPLRKEDRRWREEVVNIGCFLAEKAESVERIFCGIAVNIKP